MRRSKLPVYQPKGTRTAISLLEASTAKVLKAENDNLQPSAKRFHVNPMLAEPEKDLPRTFNFSHKTSSAVTFEATSKQWNVPLNKRKKIPPFSRMTRADMEKYMALKVVEAELRDQNQLLEVAQKQLKQELKLAQNEVHDYMIKNEDLQSENEALNKRVQNCMVILENNLIDPVSANKIIEDHEQTSACRRDTTALVENLQSELEQWGRNIMEKKERFREMKLKLQNAKEESNKLVEEMDFFKQELEEWRSCLSQFKQLLDQNVE
ncbi:small kinetochore-associated protein [Pristis pectinata]|uniref:small kinetochore-associated protein n=1 Tax=Pristis pectinata TaxID=685728 RepID=UPI00223E6955|nr:small kinetochore-associated protein [Pristis pectinata]